MMRFAWFCLAALSACAHGNGGDVDAQPADTTIVTIDAQFCSNLPCDAIYVSKSGNDSAAGTKETPLKTITAGIAKAAGWNPPKAVFVQSGVYSEQVAMKAAVTVYGGFDETWARNPAVVTEINAASPAVTFDQIQTGTGLNGVTVRSTDATNAGESSYAIVVTSSKSIDLTDVTVAPGIGARGTDGTDGAAGANGGNGGNGNPGVERSTALFCDNRALPTGGTAGTSSCSRAGGTGGAPGTASGGGSQGGSATGVPQSGGFGGAGNGHNPPCGGAGDGQPGATGPAGTPGGPGAGGIEVGMFSGARYMPANGVDGTAGSAGYGGGGGGGGGGGTTDCDSTGSSGGGGGGGGCGGTRGTGGTGGGGSFGVVAVDSSVTVKSSMVVANRGGDGGRGGRGGSGGAGGLGGAGGAYGGGSEQDDGGCGASGAPGARGGDGGHGGGGGGGPSAALVCVGMTTMTIPQSTVMGGTGGFGGTSQGTAGSPGVSTKFIGCSFF